MESPDRITKFMEESRRIIGELPTVDEEIKQLEISNKFGLGWLNIPKLDELMFQRRARYDLDFRINFNTDVTQLMIEKLFYQYNMGQNIVLNFYGQMGSTKSYGGMGLAGMSPSPPTIDTVFFRLEDIDEYLPRLHVRDTIVVDERVEVFGIGAKRLESQYNLMIETLRKRQINFYIISPIPRSRRYAYFLILGLRLTDYKTVSYLELQDVDMNCLGHLTIPHPNNIKTLGKKFVSQYEKKKSDFLDYVQHRSSVDYLSNIAMEVIKNEKFIKREKIYRKNARDQDAFRGIPRSDLKEIVNSLYPHLRRNNECLTIAEKIKDIKVDSEEWIPTSR